MDIGVGSFVAASALTLGVRRAARAGTARSRSGAMQTLVLAALGVLRLVTTSSINYQSHASEYGIHWNFFFTLCTLRGLQWALDRAGICQTAVARGVLGVALLLAHQCSLQSLGLIDYVHSSDRDPASLLSANKEGIGSLPGYAALHLLCACLGDVLAAGEGEEDASKRGERARLPGAEAHVTSQHSRFPTSLFAQHRTTLLWPVSALLQACFLALQRWVQPVSRRACNATYVVWILALNLQVVLGCAAVLGGRRGGRAARPLPAALAACNDQMLAVFLAANLLTGAVNASVDTLETGDWPAHGILVAYMACVLSLAAALTRALSGRPKAA